MRPCFATLAAAALAAGAGGCGGEYITNTMGNVTFTRNNGVVTVTMPGSDIVEGSGQAAEEKRRVDDFHGVDVNHGIQAEIVDGNAGELTVEADDNLLPLVETKVDDGVLRIRVNGSLKTNLPIRVKAGASQLSQVRSICSSSLTAPKLSGDEVRVDTSSGGSASVDEISGGDIYLTGTSSGHASATKADGTRLYASVNSGGSANIGEFAGEDIHLSAESSGSVSAAKIEGKRLNVSVSSSGRVEAAGDVEEQDVQAQSSGTYAGSDVASRTARVSASSSGSAEVRAQDEVTGTASTSGTVRYFGNPKKASVTTDSSGTASPG